MKPHLWAWLANRGQLMNAAKLKLARAASGLSLRELHAKASGVVSAQAISKYERGITKPSSKALVALASALDVPVDFLLAGDDIGLEGIDFGETAAACRDEARVRLGLLRDLERYLTVEELLGLPTVQWRRPQEAPYSAVAGGAEADCAAEALRRSWKLGSGPIPHMVELLEERGIKVVSVDADEIDSLTVDVRRRGGPATPAIVVRSSLKGERQRLELARALGHLVLDAPKTQKEKAASQFAHALLIPAETLRAEAGRRRTSMSMGELLDLKVVFRVSALAIATRSQAMGIISRPAYADLLAEFQRRGWCNPPFDEPVPLEAEKSTRFERLCFRALAEDVISESKAAELLGTSVWQLDERMAGPTA